MKQRSEEWFKAREGRFTSSEFHKLMGIKGLGQTGDTYCHEKAVESFFGRSDEEQFISFDMKRGTDLEPVAFDIFAEKKGQDFIDVSECAFFPYGDNSGSSPDGLVGKDAILEIKCPRYGKFFNLVTHGEQAIDKSYMIQMQHQMMCTNSVRCHFFNYIVYNGEHMYHEIVVDRDEKVITLIKERLTEAVEKRDEYIKDLESFSMDMVNNGL